MNTDVTNEKSQCRHFVSYSGVSLPLNLITPLEDADLDRRITYFRAFYNEAGQLVNVQKVVYSEIEFEHRYDYYPDGRLKSAELVEGDEEPRVMQFD